jgi:hypothetical protein
MRISRNSKGIERSTMLQIQRSKTRAPEINKVIITLVVQNFKESSFY